MGRTASTENATLCGDRACRVPKCRRECDLIYARATLCGDRACRVREMQARVRLGLCARNPLRRWCVSSARARVRLGLCARNPLRRSCVSSARNAGESGLCPHNPLRRSCASSARKAGESAIWLVPAQASAEIVRVECAKGRRWRLSSTTL